MRKRRKEKFDPEWPFSLDGQPDRSRWREQLPLVSTWLLI
jgi:hypothetical protein